MGVCTKLYISNRFTLEDIKTVIENHICKKVKVESCHKTSLGMYTFNFKERCMYVFTDGGIPNHYCLSLGHNEEAIEIMKTIANVLGGLFEESDCEGKLEEIQGMFSEADGLSYFLKYAILHNELLNENDLVGLNESIHKWHKDLDHSRIKEMRLFKEEE